MNEREREMMESALRRLDPFVRELQLTGWLPEVLVLAPEEIPRVEGYKVALLVPLRAEPSRAETEQERAERERLEQEAEDEERWREQALRDPGSDAYHSDGAREARIDAGLEKP